MPNGHEILLEVTDLQTHFQLDEGVLRAVDGVSFVVKPQETLGIIGESGSGKSVTGQSILRIVPAPAGRIVGGQILLHRKDKEPLDLAQLNPMGEQIRAIRGKDISMIFQEPMAAFSPVHTIGDQLMEAILLHEPHVRKGEARERVIGLLGRVGIPRSEQAVDAYPFHFSGGMRQRAMIAMALACNPRLLIADEPTTALDVTIQSQILHLLVELQDEHHMAMIFISHNLAVVGQIADEIMVMYLGMAMEKAPVDIIFDSPLHPYTQALLRSIPRIDGEITDLVPIAGNLPSPFEARHGCPFFSRCEQRIEGVCDVERPKMQEESPGHWVACHLYEESNEGFTDVGKLPKQNTQEDLHGSHSRGSTV